MYLNNKNTEIVRCNMKHFLLYNIFSVLINVLPRDICIFKILIYMHHVYV